MCRENEDCQAKHGANTSKCLDKFPELLFIDDYPVYYVFAYFLIKSSLCRLTIIEIAKSLSMTLYQKQ